MSVTACNHLLHAKSFIALCFIRFGKHFEIPLLVQSIVMLLTMFIMMEICLRMRNRASSSSTPSKSKSFFGKELNHLPSSNANCPASSFDEYSYTKLPSDPTESSTSICIPSQIKLGSYAICVVSVFIFFPVPPSPHAFLLLSCYLYFSHFHSLLLTTTNYYLGYGSQCFLFPYVRLFFA